MSTKRKPIDKDRQRLTPLMLIAAKQRIGQEDADFIELPIWIHLDAAKRGQEPAQGQQHLYMHLLAAQMIAARLQNRVMYDATVAANDALMKASQRPTELLDLTTGEYKAIRKAFSMYFRFLPMMECGIVDRACSEANRLMSTMTDKKEAA